MQSNNEINTILQKLEQLQENVGKPKYKSDKTNEQIKKQLDTARRTRMLQQKTKKLGEIIKEFKNKLGDQETKMQNLIATIKNPNSQYHNDVEEYLTRTQNLLDPLQDIPVKSIQQVDPKFTRQDRQQLQNVGFQAVSQYDAAKFGDNFKPDYESLRAEQLKDANGKLLDSYQLRALMALDDWGQIAKMAIPLITKMGMPIITKLYKKFVPQSIQDKLDTLYQYAGADEGIIPQDKPNNALLPYKQNVLAQQDTNYISDAQIEGVDLDSIMTLIAPEFSKANMCCEYPQPLAVANTQAVLTVVSNSGGNAGVIIFQGVSVLAEIVNGSDFSPASGTGTISITSYNTMYDNGSSVSRYKTVSMSVNVVMLANQNQNGSVYICLKTGVSVNLIPLSSFANSAAYQSGNSYTQYRVSFPYTQINETFMAPGGDAGVHTQCWIYFVGFPSTSTIASVQINAQYEYEPIGPMTPLLTLQKPNQGAQTVALLRSLYTQFPIFYSMTQPSVQKITSYLGTIKTNPTLTGAISLIKEALSGISYRQNIPIASQIEDDQLDMIIN